MKSALFFNAIILSFGLLYQNPGNAQHQSPTLQLGIIFNAQTCWQNNFSNICSIGTTRSPNKTVQLEPLFGGCTNQPTPMPVEPPTGSPYEPQPIEQCELRNWKGHWIDLLYNDGKRYIGIVTIEKSLVSMSSQPNTDRAWYVVSVEILDNKKLVAKMNTSFENWEQLPMAILESTPIESGNTTTTITLSIDRAYDLIIEPNPRPTSIPIASPLPTVFPTPFRLKDSPINLPKAKWNLIKGQLNLSKP
jgi:hypothetical protein